jgi:hypothetical protein
MGQYRSDRVYVFDSDGVEIINQIGRFLFTMNGENIYEVEPLGELDIDPDVTTQHLDTKFRCCVRALVVQRVWPTVVAVDLR